MQSKKKNLKWLDYHRQTLQSHTYKHNCAQSLYFLFFFLCFNALHTYNNTIKYQQRTKKKKKKKQTKQSWPKKKKPKKKLVAGTKKTSDIPSKKNSQEGTRKSKKKKKSKTLQNYFFFESKQKKHLLESPTSKLNEGKKDIRKKRKEKEKEKKSRTCILGQRSAGGTITTALV